MYHWYSYNHVFSLDFDITESDFIRDIYFLGSATAGTASEPRAVRPYGETEFNPGCWRGHIIMTQSL